MGVEKVLNLGGELNGEIIDFLPADVAGAFANLITVLQVAGIVFISYIVFLIVKWFLSMRRYRRIKIIYNKINIIDKKLDLLLGKKKIEELEKLKEKKQLKKEEKKKEKKSFFSKFRKRKR